MAVTPFEVSQFLGLELRGTSCCSALRGAAYSCSCTNHDHRNACELRARHCAGVWHANVLTQCGHARFCAASGECETLLLGHRTISIDCTISLSSSWWSVHDVLNVALRGRKDERVKPKQITEKVQTGDQLSECLSHFTTVGIRCVASMDEASYLNDLLLGISPVPPVVNLCYPPFETSC